VAADQAAFDARPALGIEPQDVLQAAKLTVGALHRCGEFGWNQADFDGNPEQRDVAKVAAKPVMAMRMAENQILNDEFHIDQAATIVLDVEVFFAARSVLVEHALTHGQDFVTQGGEIARLPQDLDPDGFELRADRRVTGAEAGARQCLVFPGPGMLQLIVAKGFDRTDEHSRIAVGAQTQIDFEEHAGRRLG
jgi:hypothetical protein